MKTTTTLALQRRAGRQTFKSVLQRLSMTLLLVMLTATAAWADESGLFDVNRFSWEYVTATQTLTIQHVSGSTEMTDCTYSSIKKWNSYNNSIQHLVIGSGITYIGKYLFCSLPALQDVTFEAGSALETIGEKAFQDCPSLTSVTLPSSLRTIGDWAFHACTGLQSVTLPEGLTTIKQKAFNKTALTSVTIPASVTYIGYNAFTDCSPLTSVTMNIIDPTTLSLDASAFPSGMTIYVSDVDAWNARFSHTTYGWIFTEMPFTTWTSGDTDVKFYNNGEMIISKKAGDGNGAMADYENKSDRPWNNNDVKKVVFKSGVTTIGKYAFSNTGLTSVTIPSSVTTIGSFAFSDCNSLTSVTMNVIDPATLSLDASAFPSGMTIYVSDVDAWNARFSHTTYGWIFTEMPFTTWTSGDTDVKFYNNGEMIISKKAGDGNGAMADYENKSDRPWNNNDVKKVVFKSGVTTIGKYAFSNTGLTSVTIPSSVTSIGYAAFSDCISLSSVTIPSSVTTIKENAFSGCISLSSVTLTEGLTSIDNCAFCYTGLTSVTIPSSVTSIGYAAFSECSSLSSVTLTEGLEYIANCAFMKTGLTSVTIPSSVTSIGNYAFSECSSLSSVIIPSSVESLGEYAFSECSSLSSVTIPSSLTAIGIGVFKKTGLTSVAIPSSVTSIGKYAFSECSSLSSVTIPSSVTAISNNAFFGCRSLSSVTIPSSVTTIDFYAFANCAKLSSVTIYAPELNEYGTAAFDQNDGGRKIYVFSDCLDTYKAQASNMSVSENDIEAIPDVTVSGVTVNQNPEVTSDYWCTYYHPAANVKINTDGVEIYKAALNGTSSVTLTKVDGNVIKAGQAVMLKAPASGSLSMELTPAAATGDYSGNELKGGATVADGYTAYTLAAKNNKMGFYKFAGAALNPNKAHLEIATPPSSAPEYLGFDVDGETTNIETTDFTDYTDKAGAIYDLQGRRVENSAKGLYIVNGRKVVIK